jgi:hypothetical protein
LRIRGVAREITLPVTYLGTAKRSLGQRAAGFETSMTVNRKDFGLTWNAALENRRLPGRRRGAAQPVDPSDRTVGTERGRDQSEGEAPLTDPTRAVSLAPACPSRWLVVASPREKAP